MQITDPNKKNKVLITGASGLIGPKLIRLLLEKGHQVSVLSRNPHKIKGVNVFQWDIDNQIIDNQQPTQSIRKSIRRKRH
jgi:nucleoside-diphosphate-sugar epimerase